MQLIFKGGGEYVKLIINRANKTLKVASSKTGYEPREQPYKMLFDKGKEKVQEKLTDSLSDNDFLKVIIFSMANQGYELQKEGFKK